MKIAIISRVNESIKWGGDLKALSALASGLAELGHETKMVSTLADSFAAASDYVFLGSACLNLEPSYHLLNLLRKPYSVIPFYEDFNLFYPSSMMFYDRVWESLKTKTKFGMIDVKDSLFLYGKKYENQAKKSIELNGNVLKGAEVCIATSQKEATLIWQDHQIPSKIALLPTPIHQRESDGSFLQLTGLKKGEYILQVGRMEAKKNQLASILACSDHKAPLVFVSTINYARNRYYVQTCIEAILEYRKAPTIIISQILESQKIGPLQIIQMPNNEKLPQSTVHDAIENAGLHIHPSFHETPGYTYLESAYFGIPTIASEWTSIREYFTNEGGTYLLDDRMEFCLPYEVEKMRELVSKKFGKSYPVKPEVFIFSKTEKDFAKEVLSHVAIAN